MFVKKEHIIKLRKIDGNRIFKKNPFKIFGSETHKYKLNNCLKESEIKEFENKHLIDLPIDYRNFIKTIGNGGTGPAYGLYKLEDWNLELDIENNIFLSTNFPHKEKWNKKYSGDENDLDYTESEEFINWELEYFSENHITGSIRICHYGCAIYYLLVVSGLEKGNIWIDDRANDEGIFPFSNETKKRYTFTEWYNEWLSESEKKLK